MHLIWESRIGEKDVVDTVVAIFVVTEIEGGLGLLAFGKEGDKDFTQSATEAQRAQRRGEEKQIPRSARDEKFFWWENWRVCRGKDAGERRAAELRGGPEDVDLFFDGGEVLVACR
jgi:hypothetical protein